MPEISLLKENLFRLLYEKGAKLIGIADLNNIIDGEMKIGISVAIPVPKSVVHDLQTAPTKEYYNVYHSINAQLNDIILSGAEFLMKKGYLAYANTTKAVKQDEDWSTPLPHKTVATRAGLGWIGKSCLLVTEEYGSAVRLSSFITDAPLPCNTPINKSRCGECQICVNECPAKALTGVSWNIYVKREEMFHKNNCKRMQIQRMKKATGIETDLCGLCFAVCPYTTNYLKK